METLPKNPFKTMEAWIISGGKRKVVEVTRVGVMGSSPGDEGEVPVM